MASLLVVEDDEYESGMLRCVLEDEEHRVVTASSLEQARELLAADPPDLVLMDRGLPDGDGLELCRELSANAGRRVRVLMLTARGTPSEVREGLEAGAADYLPKPYQFDKLITRVRELVGACA